MKWEECQVSGNDNIGIAYHSSCLVIHPKSKGCQLYSMELSSPADFPPIKEQGMFIFGGKNEYGDVLGDLRILRTGKFLLLLSLC